MRFCRSPRGDVDWNRHTPVASHDRWESRSPRGDVDWNVCGCWIAFPLYRRSPQGGRGLKSVFILFGTVSGLSFPARGRGLKFLWSLQIHGRYSRSPQGDVDWNIRLRTRSWSARVVPRKGDVDWNMQIWRKKFRVRTTFLMVMRMMLQDLFLVRNVMRWFYMKAGWRWTRLPEGTGIRGCGCSRGTFEGSIRSVSYVLKRDCSSDWRDSWWVIGKYNNITPGKRWKYGGAFIAIVGDEQVIKVLRQYNPWWRNPFASK